MNKVEVKLKYRQLQIDVHSRLRNFAVSWQFENRAANCPKVQQVKCFHGSVQITSKIKIASILNMLPLTVTLTSKARF